MLKRSHTSQSANAIMCINNLSSFEFYVTNAKRTRENLLRTHLSRKISNNCPSLAGIPNLDGNLDSKSAIFFFRDFPVAKCYYHGLVKGGRYSNSLNQSQDGKGHEKANESTVKPTSKKAVLLKYSAQEWLDKFLMSPLSVADSP